MKFHYLRYFAVLAEELHFGRAADRLAITQPPLSSAIKALEEELAVQLFVRDSKQVRLTAAGAAFLGDVRVILERVARSKDTARAAASGRIGRLDVGVTGSLLYRELPAVVRAFAAAMPGHEVALREVASSEQVEQLLRGELHAGCFNAACAPPPLDWLALAPDPFVVCLPEHHGLAGEPVLGVARLAHERFVMFAREVAPANFDNVSAIFSRAQVHPRTCHAARQWLTIIGMVANGLGVALVPASLRRAAGPGVRFAVLDDAAALSPAVLAWNPAQLTPALACFVDGARSVLAAGAR